ncbi:cytochrome c biogenesis protein CcdC [Brevibacillus fluminis]|uniref:Cytochrome c biogenesis protein CcdC n=1 Tax=Brevibacillus fluminis TaxID=511487 RepID=A0A3M8DUL0_9BACL|nr:cytochrome c biogenesis protein CcdC [Brevibacillus fluminis]RNB91189.1 cytochrome c biogenesis protein CcdC [Brevibacillus fluminis]
MHPTLQTISMIVALLMATSMIFIRMRAARKPISFRKIIAPPFFMSTGFLMFVLPDTTTSISYDLIAFCVGVIFSIPLILTSRFELVGSDVYLKRSKAFFFILVGLLIVRITLREEIEPIFSAMQTAGLFFVLAFGMIMPWRVAMAVMYRKLMKKQASF